MVLRSNEEVGMSIKQFVVAAIRLLPELKVQRGVTAAFITQSGKLALFVDLGHKVAGKQAGDRWSSKDGKKSGIYQSSRVTEKPYIGTSFEYNGEYYTVELTVRKRASLAEDTMETDEEMSV